MCTILFYSMTNVHSLVAVCLQNADTAIHELYLHGGPRDNLHMSNSGIRKESSDQSLLFRYAIMFLYAIWRIYSDVIKTTTGVHVWRDLVGLFDEG